MNITATKNTPSVEFTPLTGTLLLRGSSMPENALEFYRPIIDWTRAHLATPGASLNLRMELRYFNSSSMKSIFLLLETMRNAIANGAQGQVEWLVEDDDEFMLESGQTLMELLGMPLHFVRDNAA